MQKLMFLVELLVTEWDFLAALIFDFSHAYI